MFAKLTPGKIIFCVAIAFMEKFTDDAIDEYTIDSREETCRPRANKSKHIAGEKEAWRRNGRSRLGAL
jgi:hypothetical protein